MNKNNNLVWDETFPSLSLKGEGTYSFLHGQTTADVLKQKENNIFTSCWLSTKGILKALLEIRLLGNKAEIILLGGNINTLKDGFESVIFPADKVTIEIIKPIRRIQKISDNVSWRNSSFDWIEDNQSVSSLSKKYKNEKNKILDIYKIKQGIPSLNREINGETNPYELGLTDIVSLDKGCYLGQEAMSRFFRFKSFKYQLRYWEASGKLNDFEVGQKFVEMKKDATLNKNVGVITSSIMVSENYFNGLALIKTNCLNHDSILSRNGDYINLKKPISFVEA